MKKILVLTLLVCLSLWTSAAVAAGPSLSFSYATGSKNSNIYELNLQYTFKPLFHSNSFRLSPLVRAGWYMWDNSDDDLWGVHASVGARLDMLINGPVQPFLAISAGPGRISNRYFDGRDMGGHMIFKVSSSLGVSFGNAPRHSLSLNYVYYTNANMYDENPGFNSFGLGYSLSF